MLPLNDGILEKLIDKVRNGLEYLPTKYGLLQETKKYKDDKQLYCEVSLNDISDEFADLSLIVYKETKQALTSYLCGFRCIGSQKGIQDAGIATFGIGNKKIFSENKKEKRFCYNFDIDYCKYKGDALITKADIFGSDIISLPVLLFPKISLGKQGGWQKKAGIKADDESAKNDKLYEFFVRFTFIIFETLRNPALKHIVEYSLFNGSGFKENFLKEIAQNYSKSLNVDGGKQLTLSVFEALKNIGYVSFSNYMNNYYAVKTDTDISAIEASDNDKKFYYAFCRLHLLQEYAMKANISEKEEGGKLREIFDLDKARIDKLFNFRDGSLKNNLNCILLIEMFLHIKFIFSNGVNNLSAKSIIDSYTKDEVDSSLFIEPLLKLMSKEWESNGILSSYDHGEAGHEYSEQQKAKERRNLIKVLGDLGNKACKEYLERKYKFIEEFIRKKLEELQNRELVEQFNDVMVQCFLLSDNKEGFIEFLKQKLFWKIFPNERASLREIINKDYDLLKSEYYKDDKIFCEMLLNKRKIFCEIFPDLRDCPFIDEFSDALVNYCVSKYPWLDNKIEVIKEDFSEFLKTELFCKICPAARVILRIKLENFEKTTYDLLERKIVEDNDVSRNIYVNFA